jgi:hypothetical protein
MRRAYKTCLVAKGRLVLARPARYALAGCPFQSVAYGGENKKLRSALMRLPASRGLYAPAAAPGSGAAKPRPKDTPGTRNSPLEGVQAP